MSTETNERAAWAKLYEGANQVAAEAGAAGEIAARDAAMLLMMDALRVLDSGAYEAGTAPAAVLSPPDAALIAPWADFHGATIRHGDRLEHPDGMGFTAVHLEGYEHRGDAWRAVYDNASVSRLILQIGDKGQARVVRASPVTMADALAAGDGTLHMCVLPEDTPQKALRRLVAAHVVIALDPAVSSDAQALIDRGAAQAAEVPDRFAMSQFATRADRDAAMLREIASLREANSALAAALQGDGNG